MGDEELAIQCNSQQARSTESSLWAKQSIYKIPQSMKQLCDNRSAYQPQMVAIGPYHHGDDCLEGMEVHKQRALLAFLERSEKPLESYVKALAVEVEDLKDAYSQLEGKWKEDSEAFLQMMILDGCFLLEIMRTTTASPEKVREMRYADNDPLFSNHGRLCFVPYLKRDMLMLENQLPLLLLVKLLVAEDDVGLLSKQDQLTELILKFFSQPHDPANNQHYKKGKHILDLYRKSLLTTLPCPKSPPSSGLNKNLYVPSATELTDAGILIEKSRTRSLNDISFSSRRTILKLPVTTVHDSLEVEYRNLMAFERFHVATGKEVTSHVFFMASMIHSAGDVDLLRCYGVIQNMLGSDEAVASLFCSLSRDVTLDPHCSVGIVYNKVSDYCQMRLSRWMADAHRVYYGNRSPWIPLSIGGAVLLFALTIIQTVYTPCSRLLSS